MRHMVIAAGCLALAGCASQPKVDESAPVPPSEILSILAERPYECGDYRASSDSCRYLSTLGRSGGRYVSKAQTAFSAEPPVYGDISMVVTVTGDAFCTSTETLRITTSDGDTDAGRFVTSFVQSMLSSYDTICTRYFRAGPDAFVAISTDGDGTEIPDGRARIRFLDAPKPLYVEPLF